MAAPDPSQNDPADRRRRSISSKTRKKIAEIVGKCEFCNRDFPKDELEVYQLANLPKPPYRPDENPANSLIVLCREHHAKVKAGAISKFALKPVISHRSDKCKKQIRAALVRYEKPRPGTTGSMVRDPRMFSVFLQDKDGKRRV